MLKILPTIFLTVFSAFSFAESGINNIVTQDKTSTINIKLSHSFPFNSNTGKSMFKFKELLEEKVKKKVKIELIEKDPLFDQKKEIEALEIGALDMVLVSTDKISKYYDNSDFALFEVPYLFSNNKDLDRFVNSETAMKMLTSLSKKENFIQPLIFWPEESKVLLSRTPIRNLKDFSKLKLGHNRTELNDKFIKSLKATPVMLENESGFITKSMQGNNTSAVDVIEETTDNILHNRYHDVFKNLTVTEHSYGFYVLIANKKWFNSLPLSIREQLTNTLNQVVNSNINLFNESHLKNLKTLGAMPNIHVTYLEQNELDDLKKSSILVHDSFLNQYNKNLLLETYQILKKR